VKTSEAHFPRLDFGRFELRNVSHYHQKPGCHPVPHGIPPEQEMAELVTGGRGWVRDEGEWREVGAGDIVWHASLPGHETIGRSDWDDPYSCLVVRFHTGRKRPLGLPRFSRWPDDAERNAFVAEAVRLYYTPGFDRGVLLHYLLGRLVLWVHRSGLMEEEARLPAPLQAVLRRIDGHYAEPCSVEALAKRVGWSAAHLHFAFRTHLGQSPHKVLMSRRIRAAQEELVSTRRPIKQIAVECGFADASAFIHAFRASEGMTPAAYRLRHIGPLS